MARLDPSSAAATITSELKIEGFDARAVGMFLEQLPSCHAAQLLTGRTVEQSSGLPSH